MRKKIGCIVQARMGSTRLPGKSMTKIAGKPMLGIIIERLTACKKLDTIIVATSTARNDNKISNYCKKKGIKVYKGSENNVLKRYYDCAKKHELDVVIRVTGDCPLIDSKTVDQTVEKFLKEKFDYVSNIALRTFPRGLDVEVFSFKILEKTVKEAKSKFDKEHVTHYIYANPKKFKMGYVKARKKLFRPELRFCVDTKKDLKLMETIFSKLETNAEVEKVIGFVDNNPKLKKISITQEEKYRDKRGNIEQITLRPVNFNDRKWILNIMNQKTVRKNSFNPAKIKVKENTKYWETKLKDNDFKAFAIFSGKTPVGLARIDKKIVSIAINENFRKKGIAFIALSGINIRECIAEIKPKNTASKKLFKKLGFKEKKSSKEKIVFKKK